jgi:hypothetical protein
MLISVDSKMKWAEDLRHLLVHEHNTNIERIGTIFSPVPGLLHSIEGLTTMVCYIRSNAFVVQLTL